MVATEDHNPIIGGPAGKLWSFARLGVERLGGRAARTFHQHLDGLANIAAVIFQADLVLDRQQFVVSRPFDIFRYVVLECLVRFGTWPGTVFEHKAVFEPGAAHQRAAQLMIGVGFTAVADDKVAGDCGLGNHGPGAGKHLFVLLHRIAPLHASQHVVGSVLGGHVQVGRHFRQIAYGSEQIIAHVAREVGDEFDPADAVDLTDPL